jgi:hypothetical protein
MIGMKRMSRIHTTLSRLRVWCGGDWMQSRRQNTSSASSAM